MSHRLKRQGGVTLVELLVTIIIMGILSTMLVGTWMTLQQSFRRSTISAEQRNHARQAVSLMEREIRDAEVITTSPILVAKEDQLRLSTTFNNEGNEANIKPPLQVLYQLRVDPDDPPGLPASQTNWQLVRLKDRGAPGLGDDLAANRWQVVVDHVVNKESAMPVFMYSYYDNEGEWHRQNTVTGINNLNRILTVEVHLRIDLNPGHSPEYLDIITTVQPRNMRPT